MALPPPPPDPKRFGADKGWGDKLQAKPATTEAEGIAKPPSTLVSWKCDTKVPIPEKPALRPPAPPTPAQAYQRLVPKCVLPASTRSAGQSIRWGMVAAVVGIATLGIGLVGWLMLAQHQRRSPEENVNAVSPQTILSAREAFDHVGEDARVEFAIREYRISAGSAQTLYLYATDTHADGGEFRVIVTPAVLADLTTRGRIHVNALEGGTVRAHGLLTRDNRFTEICVTQTSQIEKLP